MIIHGLKKWEIVLIAATLAGAAAVRLIFPENERTPQLISLAALMAAAAVLLLRKPLFILLKYIRLKRHGAKADGKTLSYEHVTNGRRHTVSETIGFRDESGRNQTRTLPDTPMLTEKKGRKSTVYYLADDEKEFFISPHHWVMFYIDLAFGLLAEGVLTYALTQLTA